MVIIVVPLNRTQLNKMLGHLRLGVRAIALEQAYFSPGSVAYCILQDGEPVFAGGIVNMQWHRGEAWILPTQWFHTHTKTCYKYLASMLRVAALLGKFQRVQATCAITVSTMLFEHLGFTYEGTLRGFGPNGETCHMYARFFDPVIEHVAKDVV